MLEVIECDFAEAPEISAKAMRRKESSLRWRPPAPPGEDLMLPALATAGAPGRGPKPAGVGDRWRSKQKPVHG